MAKVAGSYDSVVLGVSEQVAHDRRSGQLTEQVNMISDPVHGLARRRGSVWQDEVEIGDGTLATLGEDAAKMREFTFVIDGIEYSLLYRGHASLNGEDYFAFLYNKTTDTFMPIEYENSSWVDDLVSGGVSAITSVGRYLYIAGNDNLPEITITDKWGTTANLQKMVAWVRGGAYSRTFKLTLTRGDGSTLEVEYKTKPSAYPTLLDTSGVDFYEIDGITPRPDYQKDINDLVYAYNSAATAYIGEAAEDITGENIAQKLVDELVIAGVIASREDSTIIIDDPEFIDISGDDGGDNTLLRAVGKEVSAPTLMSSIHYVGKIVRIRPQGASDKEAYYLEAYPKDDVSTGWVDVIWRETAGVDQTPIRMFSQAIIEDGTMYIARDGIGLTTLAPTSGVHPAFKSNPVGDGVSAPTPYFYGRTITMLAVFQDRLLIGAGNTVNLSRPGDYLHFFRHTVLNIQDNDPIEMYAYGAEGDTLRSSVMYDKDLLIFGDLKQYGITGRQVISAKSPNITTVSAHADATSAPPIASGNFVFYGKSADTNDDGVESERTSLHQIQVGQALTESPVSYEVSQALDQYIQGKPAQITALTAPNMVLYRTEDAPHDIWTYRYVDNSGGGERLADSWSRWVFADKLGYVCGMSMYRGSVLVFTLREVDGTMYVVADKQSLNTTLGSLAYVDSNKPLDMDDLEDCWHTAVADDDMKVTVDARSPHFLIGCPYPAVAVMLEQIPTATDYLWYGIVSPAYATPTNPFARDSSGRVIRGGRLTLNQVVPSVTTTSGLQAVITTVNGQRVAKEFEGRVLGSSSVIIGTQPRATTEVTVAVGHEVTECSYTFNSKDWQPMTITAIDWTGQYFNRVRRV